MSELYNDYANELHKPAFKNYPSRMVYIHDINDIWSADLIDMQEWANVNNGNKYLLNVIDIFSKYAWSKPIKDKTSTSVINAFKEIFKTQKDKPKRLWVDLGSEFYNNQFIKFLKDHNISLYSSYGNNKASIIERFNKTLKNMMWKYFTSNNTRKYIDVIDTMIYNYNFKKYHSTIEMTPHEATLKKNFNKLVDMYHQRYEDKRQQHKIIPKYNVGDWVRLSRIKGTFEKGYLPNWSREIFKINKVVLSSPITYHIEEYDGTPIKGGFYEEELQKTKYNDIFEVEKILKKRKIKGKIQYYVKWLGWSDKYNEWIDEDQIDDIK